MAVPKQDVLPSQEEALRGTAMEFLRQESAVLRGVGELSKNNGEPVIS